MVVEVVVETFVVVATAAVVVVVVAAAAAAAAAVVVVVVVVEATVVKMLAKLPTRIFCCKPMQTDLTQIRPDTMLRLIWVQTVWHCMTFSKM